MTNDELLHKWVNNTINKEELKVFKRRPEFDELTTLYRATQNFSAPKMDESKMLSNILQEKKKKLHIVEKKSSIFKISSVLKYSVAASVLLLAGWFFFAPSGGKIIITAKKGEKMEGTLPDNSTYILNSNSSLAYNEKTWSSNRELNLKGEAFFEVRKGENFLVKTPNGLVQVLGTQFNVWSRDKILEVSCQTGKVAILSNEAKEIDVLLPNDFIKIYEGKKLVKSSFSGDEKNSWVNGISKFKKAKLALVLAELENIYNVKFDTQNINLDTLISCAFQHKNLKLALKTSLSSLKISYEVKGETVILSNAK